MTTGDIRSTQIHYLWVFLLAPFVGGAFAGFVQLFHSKNCEKFTKEAEHASNLAMSGKSEDYTHLQTMSQSAGTPLTLSHNNQ